MNIFYLDHNPELCARYHGNKHVVKMILESLQLMSIALSVFDIKAPYRRTHENHPCAIWVRSSKSNFIWLESLFLSLCEEYTHRYGKIHRCFTVWDEFQNNFKSLIDVLPDNKFEEPPTCVSEDLKTIPCRIDAYRTYYARDKIGLLKYTNRDIPEWLLFKLNGDILKAV